MGKCACRQHNNNKLQQKPTTRMETPILSKETQSHGNCQKPYLQPEWCSYKTTPYKSNSPNILRENKPLLLKIPLGPTSYPFTSHNQPKPKPASPHTTQQSYAPTFQLDNTPNSNWNHDESISIVSLSHTSDNENSRTIRNQQALQQIETEAASWRTKQRQRQGQTHTRQTNQTLMKENTAT